MTCDRCDAECKDPTRALLIVTTRQGRSRIWICGDCVSILHYFLTSGTKHLSMTDEVSPWGNAHLMFCSDCAARYGGPQ